MQLAAPYIGLISALYGYVCILQQLKNVAAGSRKCQKSMSNADSECEVLGSLPSKLSERELYKHLQHGSSYQSHSRSKDFNCFF